LLTARKAIGSLAARFARLDGSMLTLPVLSTPRLVLRVPSTGDAEALAAFVSRNRDHLRPCEPTRPDSWFTSQFWAQELSALPSRVLREELVAFILVPRLGATPTIVGRCSLTGIVRGPFQAAYLGFGLDHAHVGQGFMTEALQSVLGFAFGPLELHRVMANHVPGNERSARLLERLGFEREGYAKAYLRLDGRWQDHVLTALTSERWGIGAV
jgi:[ribosomal protein S5]-alanine N-acetyltransferase